MTENFIHITRVGGTGISIFQFQSVGNIRYFTQEAWSSCTKVIMSRRWYTPMIPSCRYVMIIVTHHLRSSVLKELDHHIVEEGRLFQMLMVWKKQTVPLSGADHLTFATYAISSGHFHAAKPTGALEDWIPWSNKNTYWLELLWPFWHWKRIMHRRTWMMKSCKIKKKWGMIFNSSTTRWMEVCKRICQLSKSA